MLLNDGRGVESFAFSTQLSCAAFGGAATETAHVSMRALPMGWIICVDVIQTFIRLLVFRTYEVPGQLEANPH